MAIEIPISQVKGLYRVSHFNPDSFYYQLVRADLVKGSCLVAFLWMELLQWTINLQHANLVLGTLEHQYYPALTILIGIGIDCSLIKAWKRVSQDPNMYGVAC